MFIAREYSKVLSLHFQATAQNNENVEKGGSSAKRRRKELTSFAEIFSRNSPEPDTEDSD